MTVVRFGFLEKTTNVYKDTINGGRVAKAKVNFYTASNDSEKVEGKRERRKVGETNKIISLIVQHAHDLTSDL